MNVTKILIGAGLFAIAGYFFIEYKIKKIIERIQYLKIYPTAIKKFTVKWKEDGTPFVAFNLDLKLLNPTSEIFSAKILGLKLKRIIFYDKNNILLGTAIVDTEAVTIPANGSITIFNIPIQFEVKTLVKTLGLVLLKSFNVNDVRLEVIVSVLGVEHKI